MARRGQRPHQIAIVAQVEAVGDEEDDLQPAFLLGFWPSEARNAAQT